MSVDDKESVFWLFILALMGMTILLFAAVEYCGGSP